MQPEIGSSEWYLKVLGKELEKRRKKVERYNRYYRGDHDLGFASEKFRSAFGGLFDSFSNNFCPVVINSVEERLRPVGLRIGDNPKDDDDAWRIWQANNLDAQSQIAHTTALTTGWSYALIWDNPEDDSTPLITIEDPAEMIVGFESGNRMQRAAALKKWRDESGLMYATLYLPDRIEKYQSRTKVHNLSEWHASQPWSPRESEGDDWTIDNELGVVPVVPFFNMLESSPSGLSEIDCIIPIQDAINKLCADMLVSSEFAAFIQRWATGVEVPVDPETGKPIETFRAAVDRIFVTKNTEAKFGEFSQHDPKSWIGPIELFIHNIATQTRTPPHYFNASMGSFPSGESLKASETGLISKCRSRMRHWSESWEEVMRIAFKVLGDIRGEIKDSQMVWADPETRTESEHIDALMKKASLGLPLTMLWEQSGLDLTEIKRAEKMLAEGAKTIYDLQAEKKETSAEPAA